MRASRVEYSGVEHARAVTRPRHLLSQRGHRRGRHRPGVRSQSVLRRSHQQLGPALLRAEPELLEHLRRLRKVRREVILRYHVHLHVRQGLDRRGSQRGRFGEEGHLADDVASASLGDDDTQAGVAPIRQHGERGRRAAVGLASAEAAREHASGLFLAADLPVELFPGSRLGFLLVHHRRRDDVVGHVKVKVLVDALPRDILAAGEPVLARLYLHPAALDHEHLRPLVPLLHE
mmetsp:Transcript_6380/g.28090  ORF Transcript_6380/g.28090 Transcript_6380/m.28090 type:complete len:233 (+) Transcript_6380:1030-1728(+)